MEFEKCWAESETYSKWSGPDSNPGPSGKASANVILSLDRWDKECSVFHKAKCQALCNSAPSQLWCNNNISTALWHSTVQWHKTASCLKYKITNITVVLPIELKSNLKSRWSSYVWCLCTWYQVQCFHWPYVYLTVTGNQSVSLSVCKQSVSLSAFNYHKALWIIRAS